MRKRLTIVIAILLLAVVGLFGLHWLPLAEGDFYSTHNHLAAQLKIGMTDTDVRAILGAPDIQESVAGGRRWSYSDTGPTAGGCCIVDFAPENGVFHLCYFGNVQHIVFHDSPHYEFGSPVDGGRFENDKSFKLRWDEWHGKQRSNTAPEGH